MRVCVCVLIYISPVDSMIYSMQIKLDIHAMLM